VTDAQHQLIRALMGCTMRPGTWDKTFTHDLAQKPKTYALSDRQDEFVRRLAYKYRKQITAANPNLAIERPPEMGPDPEQEQAASERAKLRAWNSGTPIKEQEVADLWPDE
jgi:hypothetical protein